MDRVILAFAAFVFLAAAVEGRGIRQIVYGWETIDPTSDEAKKVANEALDLMPHVIIELMADDSYYIEGGAPTFAEVQVAAGLNYHLKMVVYAGYFYNCDVKIFFSVHDMHNPRLDKEDSSCVEVEGNQYTVDPNDNSWYDW